MDCLFHSFITVLCTDLCAVCRICARLAEFVRVLQNLCASCRICARLALNYARLADFVRFYFLHSTNNLSRRQYTFLLLFIKMTDLSHFQTMNNDNGISMQISSSTASRSKWTREKFETVERMLLVKSTVKDIAHCTGMSIRSIQKYIQVSIST